MTAHTTPRHRLLRVLGLVLGVALLASACGSSPSTATSGSKAGALSPTLQKELDGYYAGSDTKAPPTEGPKAQAGKNLWILSCGESISNCAITTAEAKRVAEAWGWRTTVCDTEYDPSKMAGCMDQAIAAGADGVFTYSIDCALMKQPLARAKAAGVVTAGAEALDCDEPGFTTNVSYAAGDSVAFYKAVGRAQAIAVLANVGDKANILIPFETDALNQKPLVDSFKSTIATECPGCKTKVIEWVIADSGSKLEQKVQQALVQDPTINAVQFGYTGILTSGPLAAIRASGRIKNIYLALGDPQEDVVKQLGSGELKGSGVGFSVVWEADAEMDNLNRSFNGVEQSNSGIGMQLYDADHNIKDGKWVPSLDFVAAYQKLFSTSAG